MKRPQVPAVIRWRYVLPRAAVVVALVAAIGFGLDPLLRYAIVSGGQAALGAKVEVGSLSTALLDGEITINGLAAANPNEPMRNLVQADKVQLRVDARALTHKRLVVTRGFIGGLQFDAPRTSSGALEPEETDAADCGPSMLDPVAAAASEAAAAWFADLQGRLEGDLESKLVTPRTLDELQQRWEKQHANLKTRADQLRATGKQIEQQIADAKKNPLRAAEQLPAIQSQLASVRAELAATIAEIEALPSQAKADRAAIDAARKQDEAFLRDSLKVAKTDGGQLTEYLLGEAAHEYLAETISWVQRVRSWIPQTKMKQPARTRGVTVLFVERRQPRCLIRRVDLGGVARVAGQPLQITGKLTNVASEPELHERPMQLHLATTGAVAGDLVATIDRRGGRAHDRIVIDCPHVSVGPRTLGKADSLAVGVGPGQASLIADITLKGDALAGTVEFRQQSTLEAHTPALRDDRIAAMLAESLNGVDCLEAQVTLSGTLKRPKCKIESNLGPQLADGIRGAARRHLTERRDRLAAKIQGRVDDQLAKLDASRQEAQKELLANLGEDQQAVTQLASLLGGGGSLGKLATPQLGRALSLDRVQR